MEGTSHEVRVYCKGAPDFFLMDNSDSNDMTYPELSSVQTADGVYDLNDEAEVPSELGQGTDTMLNIYKRTVKYMAT